MRFSTFATNIILTHIRLILFFHYFTRDWLNYSDEQDLYCITCSNQLNCRHSQSVKNYALVIKAASSVRLYHTVLCHVDRLI